MSKSHFIGLVCLIAATGAAHGQKIEVNKITSKEYYPQSPTAAALGLFGQTAVNYFTGTPEISVPLTGITYKDLGLDLSLVYQNTMGNKPDAVPGYTGNGWFFKCGGAITLAAKGISPADVGKSQQVLILPYATNDANWSDSATLQADMQHKKYPYDYLGKRYDEFSYSFGGASGNFYSDYDASLNGPFQHIRTLQGEDLTVQKIIVLGLKKIKIPAEPQLDTPRWYSWNAGFQDSIGGPGFYYRDTIVQNTVTYGFIVTDSKGVKYTFGNTDESIEFTRPGLTIGSYDKQGQNTIPTTWFLTSIQSPNGPIIRLKYRRGNFFVVSTSSIKGMVITSNKDGNGTQAFAGSTALPYSRLINSTLYNPCYLDSVITPVSSTKFYWSPASQQLPYSVPHLLSDTVNGFSPYVFDPYPDVSNSINMDKRFSDKLDSFSVYTATGVKNKGVFFIYSNDTTTRLKLTNVGIYGSSKTNGVQVYNFVYNSLSLPPYRSFKTDAYGYYNGKNLYITTTQDPNYYVSLLSNSTQLNGYIASRAPDTAYTQAEMLQQVIYPTGGYTQYVYENNKYRSFADNWPSTVTQNPADSVGSGLRIKTITNYDFAGHVSTRKNYYYYNNYASGGRTSSGVLNFHPVLYAHFDGTITNPPIDGDLSDPRYVNATISYTQFGTDPIYPVRSSKGSAITYSEVTEALADGSYTVHTFKNYDNGYADRPAENEIVDNAQLGRFWAEDDVNSMDLERGQSLAECRYDTTGRLRMKTTYKYNDTITRFNSNVRMLKAIPNSAFSENFLTLRYLAYLVYTYYPYLKQQTSVEYPTATDSIVTAVSYTYDSLYRMVKTQTTVLSDSSLRTTISRYPADMVAAGQTNPYQALVNAHMVSLPVEKEDQLNGVRLQKTTTGYQTGLSDNASLILPASLNTQFRNQSPETRMTYNRYDSLGNLQSFSQPGGLKTSLIWSYSKQYVVAQIANADYGTVSDVLGGPSAINDFSNQPTNSPPTINLSALRTDSRLSGAQVTQWSYLPLTGVTSEQNPAGKVTTYTYDGMGRLSTVKNADGAVIKQYCYNYAGQPEHCDLGDGVVQQAYYYSPNNSWVCDVADHMAQVQLLNVYGIPSFGSGSYVSYQVNQFYANADGTGQLIDGYYVSTTGLSLYFPSSFYIKNGQIFYTDVCNYHGPLSLRYTDTIINHHLCDSAYATRYVYILNGDTPAIGRHLYANYQFSAPSANGYYLYNASVYHVTNGIVDSSVLCSVLFPPTPVLQFISLIRGTFVGDACNTGKVRSDYCFWSASPTPAIGDTLLDTFFKNPVGAGYFSDGSKGYQADANGVIIGTFLCQ